MRRKMWSFIAVILAVTMYNSHAYGENLPLEVGGKVSIEFQTKEAAFDNALILVSPEKAGFALRDDDCRAANGCGYHGCTDTDVCYEGGVQKILIVAKTALCGCRVELDADIDTPGVQPFLKDTILKFKLCAQTDGDAECDYVWYSDSTLNQSKEDHMHIKKLYESEYPGQIYKISWEDKPLTEDNDFDDLIALVRVDMDHDGDGLWDDWEEYGIDTNFDDTPDFFLEEPDVDHKDIYLEIDYMDCKEGGDCGQGDSHDHRPKDAAITLIKTAFDNSGVDNPDKTKGIKLHVDVNDPIEHKEFIGNFDFIDSIKSTHFDNRRRFAYHYVLFVHNINDKPDAPGGQAEQPGNDLIISLGNFTDYGTAEIQAGTLMHELGHNLGLGHGGGDCINYKPNYLSIMNYPFQRGIPPSDRIDYSKKALATLDEGHLDEKKGIQDGTDQTKYSYDPNKYFATALGNGTGPIDWNMNGIIEDDVKVDINQKFDYDNSYCPCTSDPGDFSKLEGYNDWENLEYDLQTAGDFEDGIHADLAEPEMGYETFMIVTNTPPTAYAGEDQTIECDQAGGANVELNGWLSYDHDADPLTYTWEGPTETLTGEVVQMQLPLGSNSVVLKVDDDKGGTSIDEVLITVQDTTPPEISCNAPSTIIPPDVPISFTASATDNCDAAPSVEITEFDCAMLTQKGKEIDKKESCIVEIAGDGIAILDSGGVGNKISWQVRSTDSCGNERMNECEIKVVNPVQP